jgi:hypothetical protein
MAGRYINEAVLVSSMARELKCLPTLTDRAAALHTLLGAGFAGRDVRDYVDRAIENERLRRAAFDRRYA